jgi:hypothetical protein
MKTLYESLLGDIENNMKSGDDMAKRYKKATKDFKKLFDKLNGDLVGNFYVVRIKSPELAEALAINHPIYNEYVQYNAQNPNDMYNIEYVSAIYNICDAYEGKCQRRLQINIEAKHKRKELPIIKTFFYYCENDEDIKNGVSNNSDENYIKDMVKIISEAFTEKYKDIESIAKDFEANTVEFTKLGRF